MLPAFVMPNVTVPAATVAWDSSTFHSDNFTVIWTVSVAFLWGGVPANARAASSSPEALRPGTVGSGLIRGLPPARV